MRRLWEEARAKGEIPGAYWAVLTHPAAGEELVRDVFGAVHMLSHLVGAANRADIRRLADLEAANAALEEKVLRQQDQLRRSNSARDHEIAQLRGLLAEKQMSDNAPETADRAGPGGDAGRRSGSPNVCKDNWRRKACGAPRPKPRASVCARNSPRSPSGCASRKRSDTRLGQELAGIEAFVSAARAQPETEADDPAAFRNDAALCRRPHPQRGAVSLGGRTAVVRTCCITTADSRKR